MTLSAAIRTAREDELPRLQAIRAAAFTPVFAGFATALGEAIARHALSGADQEQFALLRRLHAGENGARLLVADHAGKAVGFLAWTVDTSRAVGEIGLTAVHPDWAGRGIGAALCAQALAEMRTAGARVACVSTGGDEAHAPARRCYAKAGFGPAIPSTTLYRRL